MNDIPLPGIMGSPLDRADNVRIDDDAMAGMYGNLRARVLKLNDLDPVVGPDGTLEWTSLAEVPEDAQLLFLGLDGETPHFAPLIEEAPSQGQAAYAVWRYLDIMPPSKKHQPMPTARSADRMASRPFVSAADAARRSRGLQRRLGPVIATNCGAANIFHVSTPW